MLDILNLLKYNLNIFNISERNDNIMKKIIASLLAAVTAFSAISVCMAADKIENASVYTDLTPQSEYFDEIMLLGKIGVIGGYEDKTFKPDRLVTRAEITKMIVDALGETDLVENAKYEEENKIKEPEIIFTDTADHWARLYINHGVNDNFISGYTDNTFRPDENVTYVQAQKMLVTAIGYDQYAKYSGGWPNGYKLWANTVGIFENFEIRDDSPITRAQAAKLIYNTMNAPLCIIKGYSNTVNGMSPELMIKDGEGGDWQTLFTNRHQIYIADGKLNSASDFVIENSINYNEKYFPEGSKEKIKVLNENYADKKYYDVEVTAFLKADDDGNAEIVYMR